MKSTRTVLLIAALVPLLLHSRAEAGPIISTLDYQVIFGASGTDTITGTITVTLSPQDFLSDITVMGAVDPGTYSLTGNFLPTLGEIGFRADNLPISGTFSPSDFSAPVEFTEFQLGHTFVSTSVTDLAAIAEPSSLASLAAGMVAFGFCRGRRIPLAGLGFLRRHAKIA